MKKYSVILLSTLLLSLIFIACVPATADLLVKEPLETKLNPYNNFVFSAESGVAEDINDEIADLKEIVMERVRDLHLWKTVLDDEYFANEESLIVKAVITDINTVGGFAKFMIGIFAGEASISLDVSFIDGKTGNSLGEYNSSYAGGTTWDVMVVAVDAIIKVISENYE